MYKGHQSSGGNFIKRKAFPVTIVHVKVKNYPNGALNLLSFLWDVFRFSLHVSTSQVQLPSNTTANV